MYPQPYSSENSSSTKRQHVDDKFDLDQPEPKQPRIDIDDLSLEENRRLVTAKSDKPTERSSKDNYRWRREHLIAFPWLKYDADDSIARYGLAGCKMYHVQSLTSNVVVNGEVLTLNPGCLNSTRLLKFINYSLVYAGRKDKPK